MHLLDTQGLSASLVKSFEMFVAQTLLVPPQPIILIFCFCKQKPCETTHITLLRSITMLCGTNNIPQNILHIQSEHGKYYVEYC